MTYSRAFLGVVVGLLVVAMGAAIGIWLMRPSLTEEEVRSVVFTTIQRESEAAFFVTGTLDLTATAKVTNTKTFLPDVLDLSLGKTQTTVRVPGRVSYGFDVSALRPEMIRVEADGVVRVTVPDVEVYAVEPDLEKMEFQTSVGWARMHRGSGRDVEHLAIQAIQPAFRLQAETHVRTSDQSRINTARALRRLLTPVLEAAGLEDPAFQFQVGPELVLGDG